MKECVTIILSPIQQPSKTGIELVHSNCFYSFSHLWTIPGFSEIESNKQWEGLSKNNGLVPLWSGIGRDGMVPTGSEGRWEKFKPAQRPKMTTHLWAGHVFPAFDFWHLSRAHVLVVFAHFFIFMKLSEPKWMRAYHQTTLWSREDCRIQHAKFQFWGQKWF